jgi:hypothetical protein
MWACTRTSFCRHHCSRFSLLPAVLPRCRGCLQRCRRWRVVSAAPSATEHSLLFSAISPSLLFFFFFFFVVVVVDLSHTLSLCVSHSLSLSLSLRRFSQLAQFLSIHHSLLREIATGCCVQVTRTLRSQTCNASLRLVVLRGSSTSCQHSSPWSLVTATPSCRLRRYRPTDAGALNVVMPSRLCDVHRAFLRGGDIPCRVGLAAVVTLLCSASTMCTAAGLLHDSHRVRCFIAAMDASPTEV